MDTGDAGECSPKEAASMMELLEATSTGLKQLLCGFTDFHSQRNELENLITQQETDLKEASAGLLFVGISIAKERVSLL